MVHPIFHLILLQDEVVDGVVVAASVASVAAHLEEPVQGANGKL